VWATRAEKSVPPGWTRIWREWGLRAFTIGDWGPGADVLVGKSDHLRNAKVRNQVCDEWLAKNGSATSQTVFDFGRAVMTRFGQTVGY